MNRSSGAYETLRNSACVHLPSQRTLRDYTHYIQASTGFSNEVDEMLMKVARVSTCPDREKCTLLLLDGIRVYISLIERHGLSLVPGALPLRFKFASYKPMYRH